MNDQVHAEPSALALRALEAIDAEPRLSQRSLAGRLGVSVGLTNAFLKRLARKGLLKTRRIDGKSLRYLLTPKGIREKGRLAGAYLAWSLRHYRRARAALDAAFAAAPPGRRRVAIAATPEWAEIAYVAARAAGHGVAGFSVAGRARFLGLPSVPWADVAALRPDLVLTLGARRRGPRGVPLLHVAGTDFAGIE